MHDMRLVADARATATWPDGSPLTGPDLATRLRGIGIGLGTMSAIGLRHGMLAAIRRPFATGLIVAFAWGALSVVGNLAGQSKAHPRPLFARADIASEAPAVRPDPIAALVTARPESPPVTQGPPHREAGTLVRDIQDELRRRGLYDGTVDGIAGPRTARAIRAFEATVRLPETGVASESLLSRLRSPAPAPAAAPISVQRVQADLARLGYAAGPADGRETPTFRRAIERFQADNDLPVTGIVDQRLVERLAALRSRRT